MKKITRRRFLALSAAGGVTALTSCASTAQQATSDTEDAVVALRLADAQIENYPATMGSMEFARLVEERTEGRVVIEVFTDAALGSDETAILEQVQFGAIDLARVNLSPMCEFTPILNLFQLPFLFTGTDHMHAVIDSTLGATMLSAVEDAGFLGLALYEAGARNLYNTQKAITCLADLEGMVFRVPVSVLMLDMISTLGAIGNGLAFGEVYSALQIGMIDGAENNLVSYYQNHHYEIAPHLSLDGHTTPPEILVAYADAFAQVSESDLALIMECAAESIVYEREEYLIAEEDAISKVIEAGVRIKEITDIENFQLAVTPLYERYAGDYLSELARIQAMT